jgi:glycolate oxidase iron-sulfur subunit
MAMDVEEAYRCGKCGICLLTCPVYQQVLDESSGPRAKMQLIKHYAEKDLLSSIHLNDIVSCCLMCGSCTANCPSGIDHDPLFMSIRARMASDYGQDWKKRVLFHLLVHEDQLHLAARFARIGRNTVLESIDRDIKLGNLRLKQLPKFNQAPFRDQIPEVIEPVGPIRGTILYFTGCGTQYLFEKVGHAVVQVLQCMGFRIVIPNRQVCCGLPIFSKGVLTAAKANILKNIAMLNRPDIVAVVTDCATCGSALRKSYPTILENLGIDSGQAKELAGKVRDISEFLTENFELLAPLLDPESTPLSTTYHSPCHLRNSQGVESQVELLLESLPNVRFIRSIDFDTCCGGGGTFFYDYPDISKKIVDVKISNARATGARIWATGCPGCNVQLSGNLASDDRMTLHHPVQLAASALKKEHSGQRTKKQGQLETSPHRSGNGTKF